MRVLAWPFVALWHLGTWILALTGRLVALVIGVVLICVGLILTVTVVGAVVGIPLIVVGVLLIARALF